MATPPMSDSTRRDAGPSEPVGHETVLDVLRGIIHDCQPTEHYFTQPELAWYESRVRAALSAEAPATATPGSETQTLLTSTSSDQALIAWLRELSDSCGGEPNNVAWNLSVIATRLASPALPVIPRSAVLGKFPGVEESE